MKRNTVMKLGALTLAMTMVFGSTMSVSAANGIGFDLTDRGNNGSGEGAVDNPEDVWSWMDQQDSSDSGSNDATYEEPTNDYVVESPVDNGPATVESNVSDNGSNAASNGTASAGSATAATVVRTTGKNLKVNVPGYETFVQTGSADGGAYKVVHCGQNKVTLGLKDKDGNAANYKKVELAAMDDGRYAIAFTTSDPKAAYTVETVFGDATYLPKLGVMAVTVNGTLVRDLQAEADAAAQAVAEAAAIVTQ